MSRFFDWSDDRVPVRKFAVLGTDNVSLAAKLIAEGVIVPSTPSKKEDGDFTAKASAMPDDCLKETVESLLKTLKEWDAIVRSATQNAYTDSLLEEALEKSTKLRELYDAK